MKGLGRDTLSYIFGGLLSNSGYYYRVRAHSEAASGYSNTKEVYTLPLSPLAKAVTSISKTGFTANWDVIDGISVYEVQVDDNYDFTSPIKDNVEVSNAGFLVVDGLSGSTTYYYRVRSVGINDDVSFYSNVINVVTSPENIEDVAVAMPASDVSADGFRSNWRYDGSLTTISGYDLYVYTSFPDGSDRSID